MDPFIGEIRVFCGNFAPTGWFLCQGQTLPISQYQALFAIIGTYYGGNGTSTFQLPNLQGRFVIGVGTTPSGQIYDLGQTGGAEQITLSINNLPTHNHLATSPAHEHSVSVPAHTHPFTVPAHTHPFALACNPTNASEPSPGNNYLGNSGNNNYETSGPQQMAGQNTSASDGQTPGTTGAASGTSGNSGSTAVQVAIQSAGNGLPFAPTPLYVGINFIIAYNGVFPSRP
jgi:microcystin-dependent protein